MQPDYEAAAILGGLYGDGIIGLKGAFRRELVESLHDPVVVVFGIFVELFQLIL